MEHVVKSAGDPDTYNGRESAVPDAMIYEASIKLSVYYSRRLDLSSDN